MARNVVRRRNAEKHKFDTEGVDVDLILSSDLT